MLKLHKINHSKNSKCDTKHWFTENNQILPWICRWRICYKQNKTKCKI